MIDSTIDPPATPFAQWAAGELSARDAATQIAQELISDLEPQEKALEQRKKVLREELGTLLIRIGEPLEIFGRTARWVEPSTSESVRVKQLRALIDDLRDQGSPALDGIATCIEACITTSDKRGYPLIEAPTQSRG